MSVPLLNFPLIWRGKRCPRQLKAWFDSASQLNPKLVSLADLRQAAINLPRRFHPENPGQADTEILDAHFQAWQESQVRQLAEGLFPQAREPEAESIWHLEGESLREIGWLQSLSPAPKRQIDLTRDNWHQQLSGLAAIRNSAMTNQFLVASADYLFRDAEGSWLLLLVKPHTRVKDSHVAEAEFTRWVYLQKGIAIKRTYLLAPSDEYELPTPDLLSAPALVDPLQFFRLHSLNQLIKHLPDPLSTTLPEILNKAAASAPCENPRTCSLCADNAAKLPEHHIYTLHRGGKAIELLETQGILDLTDLAQASDAARAELKERHHIQLKAIRSGQPHVDRGALQGFLANLRYPICFLDFESTCEAIPPLSGTKPWEHLPFMFSAHRAPDRQSINSPASLESVISIMDPQQSRQSQLPQFAQDLLTATCDCQTILVYGAALETVTFTRLARALPEFADEFKAIRNRIVDLQTPFAQFWYYHPRQYGKLSLKKILPLLSAHDHKTLDLQSGGEANLNYFFLSNPAAVPPELSQKYATATIAQWKENFSSYCSLDTLGLAHIVKSFYALAE